MATKYVLGEVRGWNQQKGGSLPLFAVLRKWLQNSSRRRNHEVMSGATRSFPSQKIFFFGISPLSFYQTSPLSAQIQLGTWKIEFERHDRVAFVLQGCKRVPPPGTPDDTAPLPRGEL